MSPPPVQRGQAQLLVFTAMKTMLWLEILLECVSKIQHGMALSLSVEVSINWHQPITAHNIVTLLL